MASWFDEQGTPVGPKTSTVDPNAALGALGHTGDRQLLSPSPYYPSPTPGQSASTQGAPAASGNPMDREYVKQQLAAVMQQQGITPGPRGSGPADLEYYADEILKTGGWTNQTAKGENNIGYWTDRWKSDLQGGGGAGSPGGGGFGNVGFGSFIAPFTEKFSAPTGTDDPGFQFALDKGLQGIQRSAASKGTLLTGGTMKDLTDYATGAALQNYQGAYDRALRTFGTNYGIFRDNQNEPFGKLFSTTQLGLGAAAGRGSQIGQNATSYGDLTQGVGYQNAAGTAAQYNAYAPAVKSIADWYQEYQKNKNTKTYQPTAWTGVGPQ